MICTLVKMETFIDEPLVFVHECVCNVQQDMQLELLLTCMMNQHLTF